MRMGSGLSKMFAAIGALFSFQKRGRVEASAMGGSEKQSKALTSRQARRVANKKTSETKTRYKTGGPNWLKIALNSRR